MGGVVGQRCGGWATRAAVAEMNISPSFTRDVVTETARGAATKAAGAAATEMSISSSFTRGVVAETTCGVSTEIASSCKSSVVTEAARERASAAVACPVAPVPVRAAFYSRRSSQKFRQCVDS